MQKPLHSRSSLFISIIISTVIIVDGLSALISGWAAFLIAGMDDPIGWDIAKKAASGRLGEIVFDLTFIYLAT